MDTIRLDPEDLKEIERVAREYSNAFRRADTTAALGLTVLPLVDCIDLGERAGVYLMSEDDLRHHVEAHADEDFETEISETHVEPLGRHAALVRFSAKVTKPGGASGTIEWVEFLARTQDGWKVWANWLGPAPEGFWE